MTESQCITSSSFLPVKYTPAFPPSRPGGSADPSGRGATRISCTPQNSIVRNHFGIDTLHLSLAVNWSDDADIFRLLDQQKKGLQGTSLDRCIFVGGTESGILKLNLHRLGKKYYPYHLSTADINIFLSARSSDSSIPNCSIQIGSITCQSSLKHTYLQLLRWISYLGGSVVRDIVTRIDLSCDCLGVPLSALEVSDQNSIVTRANHFAAFWEHRRLTGVQIGKSSVMCRIYDKIQEMKSNVALHKEEFFRDLWQYDGEDVTRIEFQLRREALKDMSEEGTFQEIESILIRIWRYLTEEWLDIKNRPVSDSDRNGSHQHRIPSSNIWKSIRNFDEPVKAKRNRIQRHINVKALRQQVRGCMVTLMSATGHLVDDFFGILRTAQDMIANDLADYMSEKSAEFEQRYLTKTALCFVGF